ncbi:MAG: hypothetical protein QXN79_02430 [Zestosphaera sp.]
MSYYGYIAFKAFSRNLVIIPYPLLIELRGNSASAYVVDLPQIIIISLLAYYVYKEHKRLALRDAGKASAEVTNLNQS